jgi:6-phosphofructokinase 2
MSALHLLTITPNPSIDLLFEADQLVWEDANRVAAPRRRAGGQGINVLRAATVLGGKAAAIALLGGAAGAELQALLEAEAHELVAVPAEGETRVFVAVRERSTGRSLLLNPRGPASSSRSGEALYAAAERALAERRPRWVACCGSVPPGVPSDLYARIRELARVNGARFVADCDGELLHHAARSGCDLLVPNQHEAERLSGCPVRDTDEAASVARQLCQEGTPTVAITLGAAGAVLASVDGVWHAEAERLDQGSAVGAGDAFLAALLLSLDRGEPAPEALRAAVTAGAAALESTGGDLLALEEYRRLLPRTTVRKLTAGSP